VFTFARLREGITLPQASAAMAVLANHLRQADSEAGADYAITVRRPLDVQLEGKRKLLLLLFGAAGFVLLIACSNVANLLLARATARQRELAVRTALGASRGRIVRQMLTESLLLSISGGTLGLLVTLRTMRGLMQFCPADIPRLEETRVDWSVLAFTLGASLFTGLLFGAAPAWRASGAGMNLILKEGATRSATGYRWRRLHDGLVIAQPGLSLILLIGAVLLIRSMIALHRLDLGFRPENVLAVTIDLPGMKYPENHHCQAFFESLLRQVRALPQVRSAGLSVGGLGLGTGTIGTVGIRIPGRSSPDLENGDSAMLSQITPGFLEALGVPLRQGRTLGEADMLGRTDNIVIDEYLARRYFGGTDPVGQAIDFLGSRHVVVGVVGALKDFEHLDQKAGMIYLPMSPDTWLTFMVLLVRADDDPMRLAGAIRLQTAELEKDEVIKNVGTVEAMLSGMLASRRFSMILLSVFAAIALIVATIGVYSLLYHSTTQQTHDIAIRMALGAEKTDIRRMILRQGLRLTLVGVMLGVAGTAALTRMLSSLLYDISPTDPLTLAFVSFILIGIALVASYLPARRAARIDPIIPLRHE
jgi:putative ABC transport system permease protein